MVKSCYFSGEFGTRFDLEDSVNVFIVRTTGIPGDEILVDALGETTVNHHTRLVDSFPESCVYVYRCLAAEGKGPPLSRDELKARVRAKGNPQLLYIGTVLKIAGTNIYQIYTGNLFIKFRDGASQETIDSTLSGAEIKIKAELSFAPNSYFVEPAQDIGDEVFELSRRLLENPDVEYCHPELVVKNRSAFAEAVIADNLDDEADLDWIFRKTGVYKAWNTTRGKGIKIAVIDDGLDFDHPAFSGPERIQSPRDMLDKERKRLPLHQFSEKHGTACASIACSSDLDSLGVAPEASLIPIRVTGLGSVLQSEAFYWAVDNGADVISCSWGPPDGSIFTTDDDDFVFPIPDHTSLALQYAATKGRNGKGTVVVFAAGNGKEPVKNDQYAAHESVLAIGSTNKLDRPTVYSDFGTPLLCCFPSGEYEVISIENIRRLYGVKVADRIGAEGYSSNDYYDTFDGTSASCPGVAGVVALMLSANPDLTLDNVKEIIKKSCQKIGNPPDYANEYSESYGYGLLRADRAVKNALNFKPLNRALDMENAKPAPAPALSLHIGINNVDKNYYKGLVPTLAGCVNDMYSMQRFADSLGYQTSTLTDEQATRDAIKNQIRELGARVALGGILLITYAGHGAPIPNSDNTDVEDDSTDESWVTYNGFLLDDEINETLASVRAGVRVLLVSDSCHSETVTRFVDLDSAIRCIDITRVREILAANGQSVGSLRSGTRSASEVKPKAFVKLLSACKDNQFAKETGGAGVFTTRLLEVYKKLKEEGVKSTYTEFVGAVAKRINDLSQIPGVSDTGEWSADFNRQFPFSTESFTGAAATSSQPKEPSQAEGPNEPTKTPATGNTVLVVKSGKEYVKVPKTAGARASKAGFPEEKVIDQAILADDFTGETDWDKAYNLMLVNEGGVDYVEPDMASNLYGDPSAEVATRGGDDPGPLGTYPDPARMQSPNPFIWHLDEKHSQLKAANEHVFPEILFDGQPDPAAPIVKIAHIDTGFLPLHPSRPKNLDPAAATFNHNVRFEGATDFDVTFYPAEQQGHGNATLAILAGGKLRFEDTLGEYQGYFGAIPFARVLSLKVSETVALLSGRNFAAAVDYAIAQGCDVITMSMAGLPSRVMADAVNKAYEAGVVLVSAASNSFVRGPLVILPKTTQYPARYERTIAAVGAAFDHKPYIFDIHNPGSRAAGGEFMQMCFGPDSALSTTLAAYTPNLTWLDRDKPQPDGGRRYFVKSGGGTSSATPQIAAAAALYIQKYRKELDKLAGADRWKKVELVKAALFASAFKSETYKGYYGNGILRAMEALKREPKEFENGIVRAVEADAGGGLFKRLFRFFSGRSGLGDDSGAMNEHLQEMMSTEVLQLLHREPTLHKYLDQLNLEAGADALADFPDMDNLVRDIQNSKKASLFLKQRLVAPSSNRGILGFDTDYSNVVVNTRQGAIRISSSGLIGQVSNIKVNLPCAVSEGVEYHEFEIEMTGVSARGIESSLTVTDDFDKSEQDTALLIERLVDGQVILEWKLKGQVPDAIRQENRGLFGGRSVQERDQFFFDIDQSLATTDRGPAGKVVKLIVKVFSFLKPKKAGLPVADLLAELGDSRYQLLVYDLQTGSTTGTAWVATDTVPDLFKKITDDPLPLLLLLPGLFSRVEKGFDEFLANPGVVKELKKKYGRYILGFNMPTLVQGIQANGRELDELLTKAGLKQKPCSVIARSRGGLVARCLFEDLWVSASGDPKAKAPLVLHKLVFTGTPNQGTMIASSKNWSSLINIVTNVANLTLGSIVPVLPKVNVIIKGILNQVVLLPGINDQEEKSALLEKLNKISINRDGYFIVTSNFEPNGLLKKLFDQNIIDRAIFKNQLNDSIAPVKGAIFKSDNSTIVLKDNQFHISGDADGVSHFTYLRPQNKVILEKILNWL